MLDRFVVEFENITPIENEVDFSDKILELTTLLGLGYEPLTFDLKLLFNGTKFATYPKSQIKLKDIFQKQTKERLL